MALQLIIGSPLVARHCDFRSTVGVVPMKQTNRTKKRLVQDYLFDDRKDDEAQLMQLMDHIGGSVTALSDVKRRGRVLAVADKPDESVVVAGPSQPHSKRQRR